MKLYDKVRIIKSGIVGTIINISGTGADVIYSVESDTPNLNEGYGGKWKIFDCKENELEAAQ